MRGVEVINFAQALYLKRRGYEAEKKLHLQLQKNERLALLLLHKCVGNIAPPKVQLS